MKVNNGNLETRMGQIEIKMEETRADLRKIIGILTKEAEDIVPDTPLLTEYNMVFEEPQGMPPPRVFDHAITLKLQPYKQYSLAIRNHVKLAAHFYGPSLNPPEVDEEGQMKVYPALVLDKRMVKRNSRVVTQLLMQWSNLGQENATWEDYTTLKA